MLRYFDYHCDIFQTTSPIVINYPHTKWYITYKTLSVQKVVTHLLKTHRMNICQC